MCFLPVLHYSLFDILKSVAKAVPLPLVSRACRVVRTRAVGLVAHRAVVQEQSVALDPLQPLLTLASLHSSKGSLPLLRREKSLQCCVRSVQGRHRGRASASRARALPRHPAGDTLLRMSNSE